MKKSNSFEDGNRHVFLLKRVYGVFVRLYNAWYCMDFGAVHTLNIVNVCETTKRKKKYEKFFGSSNLSLHIYLESRNQDLTNGHFLSDNGTNERTTRIQKIWDRIIIGKGILTFLITCALRQSVRMSPLKNTSEGFFSAPDSFWNRRVGPLVPVRSV